MDIRLIIGDLDCDQLERSEVVMILTCPKCATRFFVADPVIGPDGRRVECDVCHAVWSSNGAESTELAQAEVTGADDPRPVLEPAQNPVVESQIAAHATTPLFVDRASPARKSAKKASAAPWRLVFLLLVVVIVAGAFVFHSQLEQTFPGTVPFYRAAGLRS